MTILREMARITDEARKDRTLANDAMASASEFVAAVAQYCAVKLADNGDV